MTVSTKSLLYVPASKEEWFPKLLTYNFDLLVMDLEDGVPEIFKSQARNNLIRYKNHNLFKRSKTLLRINSIASPYFQEDLRIVHELIEVIGGIILPKVSHQSDIETLEKMLPDAKLEIVPTIELLAGEFNVDAIVNFSEKIRIIQFGENADYTFDFGRFPNEFDARYDPIALDFAINVIKACRRHNKVLIDGAHLYPKDLNDLKDRCEWALKMGFDGKMAIHPSQLDIINRVFLPKQEVIEKAKEIVETYELSVTKGIKNLARHGDSFITGPQYKAAKKILENNKLQ